MSSAAKTILSNVVVALLYWGVSHLVWAWFRQFGMLPAPIWPAAALSLTAVLHYGPRVAPGIYAGAVLANGYSLSASLPIALGIGVMNTAGALFGAWAMRRYAHEARPLCTLRGLTVFLLAGVVASAALSACGGVTSLVVGGRLPVAGAASAWGRWWIAHAGGILLFAPVLLAWLAGARAGFSRAEYAAVLLAGIGASAELFFGLSGFTHLPVGLTYLLIVPLVWSAVRLPLRETATLLLAMMLVAMAGTVTGRGPFFLTGDEQPMVSLGLMGMAFSVTSLLLAALAAERRRESAALAESEVRERARAEELEAILSAVPALVLVARDPECREIFGNPAAYAMHRMPAGGNLSKSAISGQVLEGFQIFRDGRPMPVEEMPMQRAARGQPVRNAELELRLADGSWHHVVGDAVPLPGPDGTPRGAVAAFVDVTRRRQAERAVREAEERLRIATDAAGLGILEWEVEADRATWENERMYEIFGRSRKQEPLRLAELVKLIHPDDVEDALSTLDRALATEGVCATSFRIRREDGEWHWLEFFGRVLRSDHDGPLRLVGMTADVTDRKRSEEKLARGNRELARRNAELEEFAYVASHDLKAPLRAIANLAFCIAEDADSLDEENRARLVKLQTRARHMDQLINALLDYARTGRVRPEACQRVALAPLLRRLVDTLALPESFHIAIASALPTLTADPLHLEQLFQNLITNAVKHHDRGEGSVRIDSREAGAYWLVEVTDDGPGIPAGSRREVFMMFRALRRDAEHTGVGLAVVRKIVHAYGGELELEDNQPRGALFRIAWPKEVLHAGGYALSSA